MGRLKKKPKYNINKASVDAELLAKATEAYKEARENNEESASPFDSDSYQLIEIAAAKFSFTPMKMRKLLITAGAFENEASRTIMNLYQEGKSVKEIQDITGLKRSSVNGYLPYSKVIYKNVESSVGADRVSLLRKRKKACEQLLKS